MGDEVGAGVRSPEEAGGFIVGASGLFSGLKGAKPHPYLLCGVLDLCHPSPRWPLPHTNKLVCAVAVASSVPSFEFAAFGN